MLSGFFVTKKGKNLLAKTHDGAHIQLTRAEIGNGDVPEGQLVTDITSLYGKIKELPLRDVKIAANDTACIPIQFSNKGILTSFELKEIGIYALDPDDGEILYLYGNTSATGDKPDEIKGESEAPLEYLFNLNLTFDNGKDVKVTVDNGIIYATVQELLDMADTKVDKVAGKGLSSEDYTTAEKNKLAGIESGANKYVHPATHPVNMITGLGTAATKDVGTAEGNVVGVDQDGKIDSTLIGSLAHVGTDGYIAYPGGGQLNSKANTQTGMLKITLPLSWSLTMLKFKVGIYNYNDNTSVDYIISGYSYKSDVGWTQTTAYCVSPWGTKLANLPVSFGHDGSKCAITIGTPTTIWDYPQVAISDVSVGFSTTGYGMWKSGWNLSFVTEALPTVNTTILNTNIAYDVNHADTADKLNTPRSIALSGGATGTSTNFDGSANISIPVTGLDAGKLTTGAIPPARFSPAPGIYTMNPQLGPSSVLHASLGQPTLAEIGAVEESFTNKIAFYPYKNALCEISSDGGATWTTDPNMTEDKWKSLVSENNNANIRFSANTQYRITITAKSYCVLNAIYFYLTTGGNATSVRIEKYNNTTAAWSDVITKSNEARSQPGHFWLQHSIISFETNASSNNYCGKVRLTFIPIIVSGAESNNLALYGLRWYGSFPGTDHRTIYSWDGDKNVTFPAQLKASEVYDNDQRVYSPSNKPTASNVTGLGTAATKNTGTSSGNVPVIESSGKLPAVIIPDDDSKQDKLTFDTTPKSGSTNPVTSAGIYTALSGKANSNHTQGHDTIVFNPEANRAGAVFPLDRGYVDTTGACRTAFMPADAITVEYTQDNGVTWKDYGLTDVQKQSLFSMNRGYLINLGGPSAIAQTVGYGVRIIISPTDNRYSSADMFYCWFGARSSTNKCTIERSTIGAKTTFATIRSNVIVAGDSDSNMITFAPGTFGGSVGQTSNNYSYRFTFITTAISTTETSVPKVTDLRLYGSTVWRMTNQMMFNGNLYSWDAAQNATFPAQLNAAGGTFSGELVPDGGIAHVGTDCYIAYPGGGQLIVQSGPTGMLKIALPVSWSYTMLKFKVSIYNYRDNESVDYIISGYNSDTAEGWVRPTAYCVGPWGGLKSNLPVSFGHDGTKSAITIGTPTTTWNYPSITISDVSLGNSRANYDKWKSGWNLSFVTEALPTVSATISNTNIAYNVRRADAAAAADKVTNVLTIGDKTFDGSTAVTLTAADLGALTSIPATYVTENEYATTAKGGVVKSSTDTNKVSVGTDGTMTVNTVRASKISGTVANASTADYGKVLSVHDTRDDNPTPVQVYDGQKKSIKWEFKLSKTLGLTTDITGHAYVALLTIAHWSERSGGWPIQIAYCQNGKIFRRVSNTDGSTWLDWEDASGGGSGTGQTWHAKDILGSGTTSAADATAESGYSVTIDTTAKSLNGSAKKYKAPFGTYVAIFRVQANTITGSTDKVKLEIWGASASIASRTLKLSDFSAASKWEYFKIPFETDSTSGRDIYPKVTCLNATGNVKVDNIVVVPNAFALM